MIYSADADNLGMVEEDVNVTFLNYWTVNVTAKYKTMNGIDRTKDYKVGFLVQNFNRFYAKSQWIYLYIF